MKAFNVVKQICPRYIQRAMSFPIDPLPIEHTEKFLTRINTAAVPDALMEQSSVFRLRKT
jgi:hypothetical protein